MTTPKYHQPVAHHPAPLPRPHMTPGKLAGLSWGVFFVWLGVALFADLGMGATLCGIGVIALVTQFVRQVLDLPLEFFWLVAGALFLIAGMWTLLQIGVPLVAVLLVASGVAFVASAIAKRPPHDEGA